MGIQVHYIQSVSWFRTYTCRSVLACVTLMVVFNYSTDRLA